MSIVGRMVMLVALWVLAWGEASLANLLGGTVLAGLLLVVLPSSSTSDETMRFSVVGFARLIAYICVQLVTANLLVAREILSRRSRVNTGVLAYTVQRPTPWTVTLIANVIALTPGTMTVEASGGVIYVHFLLLSEPEKSRRAIARIERLVVAMLGGPADSVEVPS
ncbi:MAG: Na+/H+ antiporter subunit E [Acidimicrobiia bacterium]|nr:Na+/H+ antiporter subunit E [Acidimicrobiia bacterium]